MQRPLIYHPPRKYRRKRYYVMDEKGRIPLKSNDKNLILSTAKINNWSAYKIAPEIRINGRRKENIPDTCIYERDNNEQLKFL
jgi:hypothetical protein